MFNSEKKHNRFTTSRVVLFNPHLLKPFSNSRFENSRSKYGTTIIISKDDNDTLDKIHLAIDSIVQSANSFELGNIKSPLKDGDRDFPLDKLFENCMYMFVSSSFQPKVVDAKLKPILFKPDEFQTGTWSKVSLETIHHTIDGKNIISFELINVQILNGNKVLEMRSTPEEDFQAEED